MITVALLDDHDVVRVSLAKYLDDHTSIKVAFHCSTIDFMSDWLKNNTVDIVITDLTLRGESGFNLFEILQATNNPAKVIVLTMHDSEPYISKALSYGVNGYLAKNSSPEDLVLAIEHVQLGNKWISPDIQTNSNTAVYAVKQFKINSLTGRELEVFNCLARGMKVKHVARELDIATKTVHVHRTNIMKKLDINQDFELTKFALTLGTLDYEQLIN
jgi:DNA-binding NarL/FixJ family response regulator